VTRGRLLQRAGSLGLNGSGAAAAVPPQITATEIKNDILVITLYNGIAQMARKQQRLQQK